jgi:hypothetical protein
VKLPAATFWSIALIIGCNNGGATNNTTPADMSSAPVIMGQHGKVVDYFSATPLAGFTVSDGASSTTADANGEWVLPAPSGANLAPVVTGPDYTRLYLPEGTATGVDVNRGVIPIPSTQSFALAQSLLSNDPAQAVVYLTLIPTGACTSIAGGTVTVTSPAGTSVRYFTTQGLPTSTSSFVDVDSAKNRPAAVIYNVTPGAELQLTVNHPTCTVAPSNTPLAGLTLTGKVTTVAAEPGDNNSSLVLVLQ